MKHLKWVDWRIVAIFAIAVAIKIGKEAMWIDSDWATPILSGVLLFGFIYCTLSGAEILIKWKGQDTNGQKE